jgi:predicted NAD/FAD-binding protein
MESLAIVGTGVAGMGCAHFLHKKYDVTIYEQNDYVGGHTNTVTVDEGGGSVNIDTGFMVFNTHTYPNLLKLFKELGVVYKNTDMSFGVQHKPSGLEYSGSGLDGLFAQRKNIFSPRHIKMLMQISRFNTESVKILDDPKYLSYSMADYVKEMGFGDDFLYKYLSPMSSALWSTPTDVTLTFPAVTLVRFFKNHGFLGLNTQFQWLTVTNGSKSYRDLIIVPFKDKIMVNNAVTNVTRQENGKILVRSKDGVDREFDKVIFASHADETYKMLQGKTELEENLLSKFEYQKNICTLHSDVTVMPKAKKAWASWNYIIDKDKQGRLTPYTVYYMNRLQQVSDKENYFVSINGAEKINPKKVLKTIEYYHPVFNVPAMMAQNDLPQLNVDGPAYFCGSYFKYGFHEDAFTSAVDLCSNILGKDVWAK